MRLLRPCYRRNIPMLNFDMLRRNTEQQLIHLTNIIDRAAALSYFFFRNTAPLCTAASFYAKMSLTCYCPVTSDNMMDFKQSIADIPAELRPYEKCESMGTEFLSDPELLAVIIRTGTGKKSSLALAEELLYSQGKSIGLNALMLKPIEELKSINGIGRVKAIQLKCVAELCRRMSREYLKDQQSFTSPDDIARYYMQYMRTLTEEEVHLMLLDTRKCFIRSFMVSRGTVNCSAISPREIFIKAVKYGAASFVVIHNHPSGDPTPSEPDLRFTEMLRKLGDMMNIRLVDSIIIGDNVYTSIFEKGLI